MDLKDLNQNYDNQMIGQILVMENNEFENILELGKSCSKQTDYLNMYTLKWWFPDKWFGYRPM